MSKETIFTKIVNKEIPANIIYEDNDTIAFLDIMPFEKGHTLVVPKKPYETILEMPQKEFLNLMKIVQKIAIHLEETLHCGINIWQNNKEISGQEVPHVHFHVIPRRTSKQAYALNNREKYLENEAQNYTNKLRLK